MSLVAEDTRSGVSCNLSCRRLQWNYAVSEDHLQTDCSSSRRLELVAAANSDMCKCHPPRLQDGGGIEASVWRLSAGEVEAWCSELKPRLIDHVSAHLPRLSVTVSAQAREIDVTQLSCFYSQLDARRPANGCIRHYTSNWRV